MSEYTHYLTLKVSNEEIYLKEFVQKTFSAIWLAMVSNLHDIPENITTMIVKKDGEKVEIKTTRPILVYQSYLLKKRKFEKTSVFLCPDTLIKLFSF